MQKKIKVLIAIVTYNGEKYISKCLHSIHSNLHDVDIFVFDNHSSDSTSRILKSFDDNIKIQYAKENLGFGQANNFIINYGIQHQYDFIYLLNQDTYFIDDSLDTFINFAIDNPQFAIYSPIHLAPNEKDMDRAFEQYFKNEQSDNPPIPKGHFTSFINAAAWLIPLHVLKKVGGFSPFYFHYGEDRDYANRLTYYKGNFLVCQNSVVVHNRPQTNIEDLYVVNFKKYKKTSLLVLMKYLTDINDSFPFAILNLLIKTAGQIKKNLLKLRFKGIWINTKNLFLILGKISSILNHRKSAKEEGAFLKNQ